MLFLPVILAAGAMLVWVAGDHQGAARLACRRALGVHCSSRIAVRQPRLAARIGAAGMNLGTSAWSAGALEIVGGALTAGAIARARDRRRGAPRSCSRPAWATFWIVGEKYVPCRDRAPTRADVRSLLGLSAWTPSARRWKLLLASDVIILGISFAPTASRRTCHRYAAAWR